MHLRLLLLLIACACFTARAPCQQNPASGYTIAGVLEQHGSHQPLRRVEMSIAPVEHRDRTLTCITANDGRFEFTGLPAGKYSLQAQMHGLIQGYRGDEEYSTGIVVGPGIDCEHITFLFNPPAAISGTVLDEEGEPVRNAEVFLFHKGIFSGKPRIVMQTGVTSGSMGTFHFGNLKRGTYFVAVSARPWYAQNLPENSNASEFDVAYPITYYAEALDPEGASPITLSEGRIANLQIVLRAVPALRVSLDPSSEDGLTISALGPGGVPIRMNTTELGVNGRRVIAGLAPGHYVFTVQRSGKSTVTAVATKTVDLAGNSTLDLGDLRPTSISGQLQIEGGERPAGGLAVSLVSAATPGPDYGFVAADGSFSISNGSISPGRYEIQLANTQDLVIKSVAVKGAGYSRGILDLPEGASIQLSIVAGRGLSRVNGIALKDDKPFAGAMILLLPQDFSRSYIPRDQSDSDGTFTLNSAPPGRYTLIAIDDGQDLAYAIPSAIKPYLAQAQSIDVPAPNNVMMRANVQPRLR